MLDSQPTLGVEGRVKALVKGGKRALGLARDETVGSRFEQALGGALVIGRQAGGPLKAARRRRVAASLARRFRALLEHSSDGFVGRARRRREMPRSPLLGPRPPSADRVGERPMGGSAALGRRGVVDRRAQQRIAKLEAEVVSPNDFRHLGVLQCLELHAERAGCRPQLPQLSGLARRGEHQRAPRLRGQLGNAPQKGSLDERGMGQLLAQGLRTGELTL